MTILQEVEKKNENCATQDNRAIKIKNFLFLLKNQNEENKCNKYKILR